MDCFGESAVRLLGGFTFAMYGGFELRQFVLHRHKCKFIVGRDPLAGKVNE